jgi:Mrp family chromosome partitioning ATPase
VYVKRRNVIMKLRSKKPTASNQEALVLPAVNGAPICAFPGPLVENLRRLITRFARNGEMPARLALVSALRNEGVTTLAQALAAVMAHDLGVRVCVVELNWWTPTLSALAAPDNEGLAAVINGNATLDDVLTPTGWSNLALLPAGEVAQRSRPVVAHSQALRETIYELSTRFDHLILDVPAILATNDAAPLAGLGTACCLVIRQGVTSVESVRQALDEISHLNVLGVVMNQVRMATPDPILRLVPTF